MFPGVAGERILTASDVGAVGVSEVRNLTAYTLELFQNADKSGLNQLFYPGRTAAVQGSLDDLATYAKLHDGAPDGYFCLFGTSPNAQWVFRGTPGAEQNLVDVGADNKISRVFNNTRQTLELFQGTDGSGGYQLFYPRKDTQVNASVRNGAKLVRCHNGCPAGYYCLFDGANQSGNQYVFRANAGEFDLRQPDLDANDKISSVRNLTRFTLQLFADPGPGGTRQFFYPSQNSNVRGDLDKLTTIVKVHDGPPSGCYCLYEDGPTSGRQWVFQGDPGSEQNLTAAGVGAGGVVSNVCNLTGYTLELFENTDKSGAFQMFYPGQTSSAVGGFNDRARYARLHNGFPGVLPGGYVCLFADVNFGGTQWVFRGVYGTYVRLADIGAGGQVSSVGNTTGGTVRLYKSDNCSGDNWYTYSGAWHAAVSMNVGWAWGIDFNDKIWSMSLLAS